MNYVKKFEILTKANLIFIKKNFFEMNFYLGLSYIGKI